MRAQPDSRHPRSLRSPASVLAPLLVLACLAMAGRAGASGAPDGPQEGFLLPPDILDPSTPKAAPGLFPLGPVAALAGEPVNGFPNWQERVMHQWVNRARVDPQADLAGCPPGNCPENTGGCYTPQNPLIWNGNAGRAARFHSAELAKQGYFAHNSLCTVVANISTLYPGSCDGSASCACVGGLPTCSPTPSCQTTPAGRMSLFSAGSYNGEIVAGGYSTVDSAFYGWLWEPSSTSACAFTLENGHRWLILKATGALGAGYVSVSGSPYTRYYTGDFAGPNSPIPKIPSGVHYPQQASSIDFWANWKDTTAPLSAAVNVAGTCHAMTLERGTVTNGTWAKTGVTGLGSGCHRYYFTFFDSVGTEVNWPTTGSFGIGTTGCADWEATRPAACAPPAPPTLSEIAAPVVVGGSLTLNGTGFTAGSVIKMFVSTATGPQDTNVAGWTPTTWSGTQLTWNVPATIPLGQGYGTFLVVNTDQAYTTSNTVGQLLHGDAADNLPTVTAVNGTALGASSLSVPVAHADTVVPLGGTATLTGTGFSNALVNLFTATGNAGPLTPLGGASPTQIQVTVPPGAAVGPGTFQVVNSPYTGNVQSNAVSSVLGSAVTITSVSTLGSTVTVNGTGFSALTVINLFNEVGGNVVNLGGLNPDGSARIPLTIVNPTQFTFEKPAGAAAGPAFVEALNPPFIPYSSTGNDPDGAFTMP